MIQKIRKDKKGVSPVIGVILMVAATIVIAAVVIAMLGGFTAPGKTYSVMATASQHGDDIVVIFQGGPDASAVTGSLTVSGVDSEGNLISFDRVNDSMTGNETGCMWQGTGTTGKEHVTAVATFDDGSSQVILDTWT